MNNYRKISTFTLKKIIEHFCVDFEDAKTALLLGLNRNTINHWYLIFRTGVYDHQIKEFKKIFDKAEVDESYFGARPIRGFHGKLKRGGGTRKQTVFGIFKRNGRVYTEIVLNCHRRRSNCSLLGPSDQGISSFDRIFMITGAEFFPQVTSELLIPDSNILSSVHAFIPIPDW